MEDKNSLIQYVVQQVGPDKLKQMVDQASQELSQDPDVTQEALAELSKQLTYLIENPETYPEFVASAVQSGMIDAEDLPEQFEPVFIAVILIAITELMNRMTTQGSQMFAKGGLATVANQLAAKGRYGDTMLAHINPREAEVLRQMGGSGTINPHTGLPEFFLGGIFKAIGKIFKSVAKIAAPIFATVIGGPWAGAAVGALLGAGGGGGLKGALLGGLTGSLGAGGLLGNTAKSLGAGVLNTGVGRLLGDTIGAQTLGAGLLGGAASAALGKGFLPGALAAGSVSALTPTITGLAGSAKDLLGSATGPGGIFSSQAGGTGINLGSSGGLNQVGGSMLSGSGAPAVNAAGAEVARKAMEANMVNGVPGFSLADLAKTGSGVNLANATTPGPGLFNLAPTTNAPGIPLPKFDTVATKGGGGASVYDFGITNPAASNAAAGSGSILGGAKDSGILGTGISGSQALMGATLLGGLTPPQALQQIEGSDLTPEQKEAMARGLTNYTAKYNMTILPQQGTPEYDDMMNNIKQGIGINFMNPTLTNNTTGVTQPLKRGGKAKAPPGGLSQVAMLASGTGSGRDDTINARLSDGEYVLDAETVALLGNGSTKAGAAVLDQMREQLRKQKGKALAKGKFSPDAKSPLAYMKGGLK